MSSDSDHVENNVERKRKNKNKRRRSETEEDSGEHHGEPSSKMLKGDMTFGDEYDVEDEEGAAVDESIMVGGIDPATMIDYVKSFGEFMKKKEKSAVQVKFSSRYVDDFLIWKGDGDVDAETFTKSYRKYLALALKSLTTEDSIAPLISYLDRGESILAFPDFPQRPQNLAMFYAKKNNLSCGFGKINEVRKTMLADHAGREECEHELGLLEEKYLRDLEEFGDKHKLTANQQQFMNRKIATLKKKLHGPVPKTPKATKTPKKAKKDLTAFDMFCRTCTKYDELDAEKRLKKLQKKFDKLDANEREIYEKCALLR